MPTLTALPLKEWSVDRVGLWLASNGMSDHVDIFMSEGVDGASLLTVTEKDLEEDLQITNRYERRRVWEALQGLCEQNLRIHTPHLLQPKKAIPPALQGISAVSRIDSLAYPVDSFRSTAVNPASPAALSKMGSARSMWDDEEHLGEIDRLDSQLGIGLPLGSLSRRGSTLSVASVRSSRSTPGSTLLDEALELRHATLQAQMKNLQRESNEIRSLMEDARHIRGTPSLPLLSHRKSGASAALSSGRNSPSSSRGGGGGGGGGEGNLPFLGGGADFTTSTTPSKSTSPTPLTFDNLRRRDSQSPNIASGRSQYTSRTQHTSRSSRFGVPPTGLDFALDKVLNTYDHRTRQLSGRVNYNELLAQQNSELRQVM
eukprot:NODE_618_length_1485_cov_240.048747_g465_i0.p1 GENE.NODE_618_length_1485_cov_240.048747_g465_i0~~NODE_618_length_1485_cov_240.048747_g465_i0.p1  ORF type:complete len:372 (+),score=82.92 NODE_618_length_1485_cov_240.048747_g465_i0:95-1210(+)